ncbi:MAG: hypothetical protein KGM96_16305 [Acidobacteriota bacterium]|nr:hypothetical protein [Acidobacteriota bacterium]
MTLQVGLPVAASCLEIILLVLLFSQRTFRLLPVFFYYRIWCLGSGIASAAVVSFLPHDYAGFYLLNLTGDALFQLAVLAELWQVIVRHNRVRPPSRAIIGLLLLLALSLILSIARWTVPGNMSGLLLLSARLRQVFGVLQFAALLALVWLTSFWGLRWPGRALQVATGLGFYFLVDLAVIVLHTHEAFGAQFLPLEELASASYVGVLAYWVFCFARTERDRQEAAE